MSWAPGRWGCRGPGRERGEGGCYLVRLVLRVHPETSPTVQRVHRPSPQRFRDLAITPPAPHLPAIRRLHLAGVGASRWFASRDLIQMVPSRLCPRCVSPLRTLTWRCGHFGARVPGSFLPVSEGSPPSGRWAPWACPPADGQLRCLARWLREDVPGPCHFTWA